MTYSECIANLKMIKIMLDDNEQAEVISKTIDMAINCVDLSRKETEFVLKMLESE